MSRFNYLIEKLVNAEFTISPFKHVYIENFFTDDDFDAIIKAVEIDISTPENDDLLFRELYAKNYLPISFPGCITDVEYYKAWHKNKDTVKSLNQTSCEGFGMTVRLMDVTTVVIQELKEFIEGEEFNRAVANKFDVVFGDCLTDSGIQKYLDGYEISPHPDIRRKAATFMVNINPSILSENLDHHTHYMKFSDEYSYIKRFWEKNTSIDRSWMPWEWCRSEKQQTKNNSIVLFSPSNDTLHAVKASYSHYSAQRTQLYGNLWYREDVCDVSIPWENLDILGNYHQLVGAGDKSDFVKSLVPNIIKKRLKNLLSGRSQAVGKRRI